MQQRVLSAALNASSSSTTTGRRRMARSLSTKRGYVEGIMRATAVAKRNMVERHRRQLDATRREDGKRLCWNEREQRVVALEDSELLREVERRRAAVDELYEASARQLQAAGSLIERIAMLNRHLDNAGLVGDDDHTRTTRDASRQLLVYLANRQFEAIALARAS